MLTVVADTVPTGIDCRFYADHQSEHFRSSTGAWRCRVCSPEEESPS